MIISINKMVTLSYTLRSENADGEIIEQTSAKSPLKFVFGIGSMLPMFESNLTGLKQGDNFEMSLKAKDAYGEINEDAIVDLDKNIFVTDGIFDKKRFTVGTQVPMQTSDGQRVNGTIVNIGDHTVKMDFNHPLAGVNLHFTGNIIEVRDATKEELSPSGYGCGSGCCGCGSESCE